MRTQARRLFGTMAAIALLLVGCDKSNADREPAANSRGPTSGRELISNAGFEQAGSPAPQGWMQEVEKTAMKGTISQDRTRFHSGRASLKLQPNALNGGKQPLAVAQVIQAAAYRGRKVEFSGYMRAEGGAQPALAMLSIVRGRPSNLVMVRPPGGSSKWFRGSHGYDVPDDPSVQLVLTCFVGGKSGAAWFDDLSVVLPGEPGEPGGLGAPGADVGAAASADLLNATVEVDAGTVIRRIPRTLYGTNVEWIWNANVMWQEKQRRVHPQVLRLTRELGVTLIRYPGGLLSDFYHWRNGIGPHEQRPQVQHEPGKKDRTRANFGTDEALDFARRVKAELLITVNAGTGTAREAADWVSYVKGKTPGVRFWEVGNELYIKDGSPVSKATTVDPATYAKRYLQFAKAMRKADPSIKIGAIGGENYGRYSFVGYPDWDRIVLQTAGRQIDFLAVHNAYAPLVARDSEKDLRTVYKAMLAAPVLIARNLDAVSRQIDQYAPARASKIGIAVTEWGPVFMFDPRNRYVDHAKTLGSALFAASVLKVFIESPRTEIANFFLLNDMSALGWIGSRNAEFPPRPDWAPTARYYAFQLYTHHFGEQLVPTRTAGPTYNSRAIGLIDAVKDVPYLDVVSSLSPDGGKLYVMAINKHFDSPIEAAFSLRGFRPDPRGTAWTLTGTAIDANTGTKPLKIPGFGWARQAEDKPHSRFAKGGPGEITLSSAAVEGLGAKFSYRFPPHSVTSLVLKRLAGGR